MVLGWFQKPPVHGPGVPNGLELLGLDIWFFFFSKRKNLKTDVIGPSWSVTGPYSKGQSTFPGQNHGQQFNRLFRRAGSRFQPTRGHL